MPDTCPGPVRHPDTAPRQGCVSGTLLDGGVFSTPNWHKTLVHHLKTQDTHLAFQTQDTRPAPLMPDTCPAPSTLLAPDTCPASCWVVLDTCTHPAPPQTSTMGTVCPQPGLIWAQCPRGVLPPAPPTQSLHRQGSPRRGTQCTSRNLVVHSILPKMGRSHSLL